MVAQHVQAASTAPTMACTANLSASAVQEVATVVTKDQLASRSALNVPKENTDFFLIRNLQAPVLIVQEVGMRQWLQEQGANCARRVIIVDKLVP